MKNIIFKISETHNVGAPVARKALIKAIQGGLARSPEELWTKVKEGELAMEADFFVLCPYKAMQKEALGLIDQEALKRKSYWKYNFQGYEKNELSHEILKSKMEKLEDQIFGEVIAKGRTLTQEEVDLLLSGV